MVPNYQKRTTRTKKRAQTQGLFRHFSKRKEKKFFLINLLLLFLFLQSRGQPEIRVVIQPYTWRNQILPIMENRKSWDLVSIHLPLAHVSTFSNTVFSLTLSPKNPYTFHEAKKRLRVHLRKNCRRYSTSYWLSCGAQSHAPSYHSSQGPTHPQRHD